MKMRFKRFLSGFMAVATLASVIVQPVTVSASELEPEPTSFEQQYPELQDVQDTLDKDEIVEAKDIEIPYGEEFEVEVDLSGIEGVNEKKVKVLFHEAKSEAGTDFDVHTPDTYKAVYAVEPVSGHPAYRVSRNITIKEPETEAQTKSSSENTAGEGNAGETEDSGNAEDADSDGSKEIVTDLTEEQEVTTDEESGLTVSEVMDQVAENGIDLYSMEEGEAVTFMAIRLSLVIYGIAIFQAVFFYFCMKHTRRLMHENLERQEVTYTYLLEVLKNILFIKSSDSSIDSINQWREIFSQQMTTSSHKEKFSNLFQCILMVLKLTPSILLLALGSYEIAAERLSLGGLMALVSIGSMFINPVSALANDMQDIVYLRSVLERLMEIYYAEKEENINKKGIEKEIQRIQLTNVSFKYFKSGENILKRINISIKRGEKIAIVGKTGCGKSTLIKLILGLYKPTEGQLMIDGNKITELDVNDYRKHIGITMQEAYFFDDTIEKNIDISKKCEKMQIQKAAQMARLDQDISCMEKGYETRIGENGKNLSGGQRQRLSIARALVKNPDIIIFDEGTGQLDAITEKEIYKELKNNNITQIIVTHRLSTIKDADYIYLIEQGEIVEQGMHKDLIETEGMYAKMWKEQN